MEKWLQKLLFFFGAILILLGSLRFAGVFSDYVIRHAVVGSFKARDLLFFPALAAVSLQTITLGLLSLYAAHTLSSAPNSFNCSLGWVRFVRKFLIVTGALNCVLALFAFVASLPHTLDIIIFDRTSEFYQNSSIKFHLPSAFDASLGLFVRLFTTIATGTLLLYLAHRISPLNNPFRKT